MKDDSTSYEDEADMADKANRTEITKVKVDGSDAFFNLDSAAEVSVATLTTSGDITQKDKTLNETYAALGENTEEAGGETLGVTQATFIPNAHTHTTSESLHSHTYSKVTEVAVKSSGTSDSGKADITCELQKPGSVTLTDHSHTYQKATSATFTGSEVTSESATTNISAALDSAPTFSPTAHNHGVTDKRHSHSFTATGTNTITTTPSNTGDATTTISAKFTKTPYVTACGTHTHAPTYTAPTFSATVTNGIMSFSLSAGSVSIANATASNINLQNTDITATSSAHSHTYDKTTAVTFTGTSGQTTSSNGANITINNASAGGSVSKPSITVTDNGHTHKLTAKGDVVLGDSAETTGDSKSTATFADPSYTVTDKGHTHKLTNIEGSSTEIKYDENATSGSTSTRLTINETSAGGTINEQAVTIPAHSHKQQ